MKTGAFLSFLGSSQQTEIFRALQNYHIVDLLLNSFGLIDSDGIEA